jgi:hypothetical protein
MNLRPLLVLAGLALALRLPAADTPASALDESQYDHALQAELLAIRDADQSPRLAYQAVGQRSGWNSPDLQPLAEAMMKADAENLPRVTAILDRHGWVGPDVVGPLASDTLFLVIQHSNPDIQRQYLPMLRDAVKQGKAQAGALAMMEDRVAVAEGRPQLYGTQLYSDAANPVMRLRPIEDPEHVDERRAAVGLPPMAEYLKHWNLTWDAKAFAAAQAQAETK